jgi:hypothetical protein
MRICVLFGLLANAMAVVVQAQPRVDELTARTTLSKQQAEWVVREVPIDSVIELNRLTEISPETAKALAAHDGGISLEGLDELTPEAAKALSECRGGIYLPHRVLSPPVYTAIAPHPSLLEISDVEELSPAEAEAISKHQGAVSLPAIKSLSAEAARSLKHHRGDNPSPISARPIPTAACLRSRWNP